MQLIHAAVQNFRALEDVGVRLENDTTLVVGRNNSGKTSFVNLFDKFFGEDDGKFVLEDFSTARIADIKKARDRYGQAQAKLPDDVEGCEELVKEAATLLPQIRLTLTVSYDEIEDLAPLSEVILDLDETCFEVKIEAVVAAASPRSLLAKFWAASTAGGPGFDEDRYLRRSFSQHFTTSYFAVTAGAGSAQREPISRATAHGIVSVKFVYAQVKFDDTSADRTRHLSKTFEAYYRANSEDEHRNQSVERIERALESVSQELDDNYEELFKPIFRDLQTFGVGSIAPVQSPRIVSMMEASGVLHGSTRIQYTTGENDYPLPEGHNGLGYSKLIFTILQIVAFHETHKRSEPRPALQLLFVEEPEAHLHPQMQETFIKNVLAFVRSKPGWNVQVVITTHSSHIVASSDFASVRYFDSTGPHLTVKDLSAFQRRVRPEPDGEETLRFLRQYMVLHRCDMFFADKVILIEGAAERLLLPEMIRACAPGLFTAYISVIEVGDAYAVRFRELLAFLGVQTLIITDIDSVDAATGKTCGTGEQDAVTSNRTLGTWLPGEKAIATLMGLDDTAKIHGRVRVAYQVPERIGGPCGRSFEDAFILANTAFLAQCLDRLALKRAFTGAVGSTPTAEDVESSAPEIAKRLAKKKTDFAFDMMMLTGWSVPRYIREGLQWLS